MKKPKKEKFKRGKNNPLITSVVDGSIQMDSTSGKFNTDCCILCNNREIVRAIRTQNRSLFDTILKSKKKISSFEAKHGCKMLENTISLSLDLKTKYYFEKLMGLKYPSNLKEKNLQFLTQAEPSR